MNKKKARAYVREQKRKMSIEEIQEKSNHILEKIYEEPGYQNAHVIYCYVSYNQEVMTRPLIRRALEEGKRVAVPKVTGKEIEFFYLDSLEELKPGYQGIEEPVGTKVAREKKAYMILPGLAFDKLKNRVGYGGGFYDRYLEKYKDACFIKLAVAFDFQVVDQLETDSYDQKVDCIITERTKIGEEQGE